MKSFNFKNPRNKAFTENNFIRPLLLVALFLIFSINTWSQNNEWAFGFPDTTIESGNIIKTDANGNVYVAGNFKGANLNFNPYGTFLLSSHGVYDIFIAKYNASGKFIWAKSIGGIDNDMVYSMIIDNSGYIYIAGSFAGIDVDFDPGPGTDKLSSNSNSVDIFFSKFDTSGNHIWAKGIGGTGWDEAWSICRDNSSNIIITGRFAGTVDFDPSTGGTSSLSSHGNGDIFIAKYNSSGDYLMSINMGGSLLDVGYSIVSDNSNNIYITGKFSGTAYFDPADATKTLISSLAGTDIFIAKYNSSGNYIWAKKIGGAQADYSNCILVDGSNLYITGALGSKNVDFDPGPDSTKLSTNGDPGSYDIFIAKYDTSCAFKWAHNYGGEFSQSDEGKSIATDIIGNVYISGYFTGTNVDFDPGAGTYYLTSSNYDIFMAKYDASGNFKWADRFATTGMANSIITDANQNVYITGGFTGNPANFGTGTDNVPISSGSGTSSIFIAKYTPQATKLTFSNVTSSSFKLNWHKGTGDKKAVFVYKGTSGSAAPVDNNPYGANTVFKSGMQIGFSGWYCVYNDTGRTVSVTGLDEASTYRAMVCEYTGGTGSEKYNTYIANGNPSNVLLPYTAPTIQDSNILVPLITLRDTSAIISFAKGNGTKRLVIMSLEDLSGFPAVTNKKNYKANSKFGSGDTVGIIQKRYCVYNDTGNHVTVRNLTQNTTYRVTVIEYNGTSGAEAYNVSTVTGNPKNFKTKYTQIIIYGSIADKTYGAADFNPGWISDHSLPIKYSSSNTSFADTVAGMIHIVGAGTCTIYGNQSGNDTIVDAHQASTSFTVLKASLNISADTLTRTYGELNPVLTWKAIGLQYDDSVGSVTIASTTIDPRANPGNYDINISAAIFGRGLASNYSIVYQKGILEIVESPIKICLVTIDIETGYSMVIWERDNITPLLRYDVYRQGKTVGVYDSIGAVPISEVGIFIDSASHFEKHPEFYKIATVNPGGVKSRLDQCNYHKTILLQASLPSGGVVPLTWSPYEVENSTMTFKSYVLYKGTDSTKLTVVDTIAANVYNYNDADPLAQVNKTYYRIAGIKWTPCYPEGHNKAGAGPFSQSVSNMEDNRLQSNDINMINQGIKFNLAVVPNPVNKISVIKYILPRNAEVRTYVVNILGETVAEFNLGNQKAGYNQFTLNAGQLNLTNGIYFLKVNAGNANAISKISVAR